MAIPRAIAILNLGRISYTAAWRIQNALLNVQLEALRNAKSSHKFGSPQDVLILCEHNPVYTVGIRTKDYPEEEENRLKDLGADFVRTNRGGLITFHGPGQLVAYPIINLKKFAVGVKQYICLLEKVLIQTCRWYGLQAQTTDNTGVWIGDKKIAAIGISCKRYITQHGVSLNCSNDLSWFDHIVPCGITGKGVTSLQEELKQNISLEKVTPIFIEAFCDHFGSKVINHESDFDMDLWKLRTEE